MRRIFTIFGRNEPHKNLMNEYVLIRQLSDKISVHLAELRKFQKRIILKKMEHITGSPTGGVSLEKALFIEEGFIKKLSGLARKSEDRFSQAISIQKNFGPISPLEVDEIKRVLILLKKIEEILDNLIFPEGSTDKQKLLFIDEVFRELVTLGKKFHEVEVLEARLAKKVEEDEVSPLLADIYRNPKTVGEGKSAVLTYKLTPGQLKKVSGESQKINRHNDPDFKIIWRRWWRRMQKPEVDKTGPLKNVPHVNVTLKLFGGRKKDIHLLVPIAA